MHTLIHVVIKVW